MKNKNLPPDPLLYQGGGTSLDKGRWPKARGILLAINTASPEAVLQLMDGGTLIGERRWTANRNLGTQLLEELDALLTQHHLTKKNLTMVAGHCGPGHYSAVRTGVVTATTLAHGLGIQLAELHSDGSVEPKEMLVARY